MNRLGCIGEQRYNFLCAADAFPLAPSPVPNEFEGTVVRDRGVRSTQMFLQDVELSPNYQTASLFSVQKNEDQRQRKIA